MSTWCLRVNTGDIRGKQQRYRWYGWRNTTTRGTRCWRHSRCRAPEPAGLGEMPGWHCRATSRWTSCTCPWSGDEGSDCRDAQKKPRYASLRLSTPRCGQAGERLLHAQTHCENCVLRDVKLAEGQKVRGALSGLDKARLGLSAPRTVSQFCLSFA